VPPVALTAKQLKSRKKNARRDARRKAKGEPARMSAARKTTRNESRRLKEAVGKHAFRYCPPQDFQERHPAAECRLATDAILMNAASTAFQGLPYRTFDPPSKLDTFVRGVFNGDKPFPMLEEKEWTVAELVNDYGFMLIRWDGM
jgi:hypothetical protein